MPGQQTRAPTLDQRQGAPTAKVGSGVDTACGQADGSRRVSPAPTESRISPESLSPSQLLACAWSTSEGRHAWWGRPACRPWQQGVAGDRAGRQCNSCACSACLPACRCCSTPQRPAGFPVLAAQPGRLSDRSRRGTTLQQSRRSGAHAQAQQAPVCQQCVRRSRARKPCGRRLRRQGTPRPSAARVRCRPGGMPVTF